MDTRLHRLLLLRYHGRASGVDATLRDEAGLNAVQHGGVDFVGVFYGFEDEALSRQQAEVLYRYTNLCPAAGFVLPSSWDGPRPYLGIRGSS